MNGLDGTSSFPTYALDRVSQLLHMQKWLLTETVDSSISYVDSHLVTSGSVFSICRQIGNTHVKAEGLISV